MLRGRPNVAVLPLPGERRSPRVRIEISAVSRAREFPPNGMLRSLSCPLSGQTAVCAPRTGRANLRRSVRSPALNERTKGCRCPTWRNNFRKYSAVGLRPSKSKLAASTDARGRWEEGRKLRVPPQSPIAFPASVKPDPLLNPTAREGDKASDAAFERFAERKSLRPERGKRRGKGRR